LMDSIVSPKVKTTEEERVGVCSMACNILGVEGSCWSSKIKTRKIDKQFITHMDLHKLNNKLVNA
jgi:hypothetical protein